MNERGFESCPFCGSDDVWGTFYAPMEHLVFCGECGAKIMGATSYDEAKKLWNRRSTEKWTPCKDKDRLPKIGEEVLVQDADGDMHVARLEERVVLKESDNGSPRFVRTGETYKIWVYVDDFECFYGELKIEDSVAWMHKPAPYKEEE